MKNKMLSVSYTENSHEQLMFNLAAGTGTDREGYGIIAGGRVAGILRIEQVEGKKIPVITYYQDIAHSGHVKWQKVCKYSVPWLVEYLHTDRKESYTQVVKVLEKTAKLVQEKPDLQRAINGRDNFYTRKTSDDIARMVYSSR